LKPNELAEKIDGLTLEANERFAGQITSVQDRLYSRLVGTLKRVDIDADGYIIQSADNRKILNEAINSIDESFAQGTPYTSAIEQHLEVIPAINELNEIYFKTISSAFTPNKQFIKSLQKQTISGLERSLLNEGIESQIKGPLIDILNRNINTGGSFSGFLKEVQDYVKGTPDLDGRLLSYSKGIVRDALTVYARSFQQAVVADLGLKWYLYAGGLMDTSRPFCVERAGKYYYEDEVKAWAHLEWTGKMRGTTESSIFQFAGGYFCGHQLIPVHESIVPKIDLDRIQNA
jgi:hypothetical protein